jgi:uncharacterized damage-inducible protein DinB
MIKNENREAWLRGAIDNVPPLLQPVAHALLQAREEVNELVTGFRADKLWVGVAGLASVGFHLQHLTGVLDRLCSYALNKQLTDKQLEYLAAEDKPTNTNIMQLLTNFNNQVDLFIKNLEDIDETTLTQTRGVGRAKLPSTVIGLLVHAAEHTMRHTGQLLVTVTLLR